MVLKFLKFTPLLLIKIRQRLVFSARFEENRRSTVRPGLTTKSANEVEHKMTKEGKETNSAVLQYLVMQNRPFGLNDLLLSAQLKEYGKSAVQKTLDQLVVVCKSLQNGHQIAYYGMFFKFFITQAGKVKEKSYGKQKVFVIDQDLVSSPNDPDLAQMDSKIAELTRKIAEDQGVIKQAEAELKTLDSTLSIEDASAQLETVFGLCRFLSKAKEQV